MYGIKIRAKFWYCKARSLADRTSRGAINMGKLFFGFILMIVGLVLFPTIQTTVTDMLVNASGATAAIGALIPLLWVLVVCGIGIGLIYEQFKGMDGM